MSQPTAVYRLFDAGDQLLWVGSTRALKPRLASHRRKPWWPEVARVAVQRFASREEARQAETRAIRTERPRHNIVTSSVPPAEEEVGHTFRVPVDHKAKVSGLVLGLRAQGVHVTQSDLMELLLCELAAVPTDALLERLSKFRLHRQRRQLAELAGGEA